MTKVNTKKKEKRHAQYNKVSQYSILRNQLFNCNSTFVEPLNSLLQLVLSFHICLNLKHINAVIINVASWALYKEKHFQVKTNNKKRKKKQKYKYFVKGLC